MKNKKSKSILPYLETEIWEKYELLSIKDIALSKEVNASAKDNNKQFRSCQLND